MESKHEQLAKLQQLLSSGALTPEEFAAARERILNAPNLPDQAIHPRHATTKSHIWIWIVGGIVLLVASVVILILYANRKTDVVPDQELDYTAARAEAEAYLDEVMANCIVEGSDEHFENNNPWHLEHFKNEWGEDIDRKYIYTVLRGSGWNIRIDYIPGDAEAYNGVLRFSIVDSDWHVEEIYGPVNILIRPSSGETHGVPVVGVKGSMAFVEDPATVEAFKALLDQDKFDILMEFEKYNERHRCQARWESTPGYFQRAVSLFLESPDYEE